MARKSRKVQPVELVREISCRAAVYIRLSVEDTKSGSISIETQRMIIDRFLAQHPEIAVYNTYIDNGATGTNFHRPGFQQMLSDIEAGEVNCVIVKDLSRLGRNAIDTGYYIEQYFRVRKVRFIAVNDQFDTEDQGDAYMGIILPLRNMINEAYALDIGRKIKAQQRQAMKDGKFVGGRAPYGYQKDPEDCHQLVVDQEAAPVVRLIFAWASEGAGLNTIALRLNEAGCPSPSFYKRDRGEITHQNLIGSGKWQTRTVAKILHAEVYTGDLVQGRTKIIDHKQVPASAEEMTVVRGTHEAIISREQFDAVQAILEQATQKSKSRTIKPYSPNLLKGKVFCGCCGGSLHRQRATRKTTADVYWFHCLARTRIQKDACPGVAVQEPDLLEALTDLLIAELDAVLGEYALHLEQPVQEEALLADLFSKLTSRRQEIGRLRGLIRGLYENLVKGILSKEEYFSFKDRYEGKIAEITAEIEHLETGLRTVEAQRKQYQALAADAKALRKNKKLTAALLDRLVERVVVFHDRTLAVQFKFNNEFAKHREVLEKCKAM